MSFLKEPANRPALFILICILTAMFMSKLDDYIVSIALPYIATEFKVSASDVSLVTLSYMMALTSTIIIWGALGDRIGFKKMLIGGFILFILCSFLCGFSTNIYMLVGLRFLQGFGGSILLVSAQAMIPIFFEGPLKAKAFGLLTVAASVGMTLGPTLGGMITQIAGWQWVFFINIPVGIAIILVTLKYIPDKSVNKVDNNKPGRPFDITGAILIFLSMLCLVMALNRGQEVGWFSGIIVTLFSLSVVFFVALIIFEMKHSAPLLDFGLLKNKNFAVAVASVFCAFLLIGGNLFLMPFYLTIVLSLNAFQAGLAMVAYPLFFLLASSYNVKLINKYSRRFLCTTGFVITLGSWVMFNLTMHKAELIYVIIFLATTGIGLGLFFAPNNRFAMDSVSVNKSGVASGIYRTLGNLGIVLGIDIFETIYSSSLPHNHPIINTSTLIMKDIPDVVLSAFQYAYLFGIIICLIPLMIAFFAERQKASD